MRIIPRFEFRAFAQNFGIVEQRLRDDYKVSQIRESSEIYFLHPENDRFNLKLRNQVLDIKALISVEENLEQWKPVFKEKFPLQTSAVSQYLSKACQTDFTFDTGLINWEDWISFIASRENFFTAAHIFKKRTGFDLDEVQGELADVLVNGALMRTASLESENKTALLEKISELELDRYENVNYVRALKEITGLILPEGIRKPT